MNIISGTIGVLMFEIHFHIHKGSISIFVSKVYQGRKTNHYNYGIHLEYYGWGIYYGKKEYFHWFRKYADQNRLNREQAEKEWKEWEESAEYKELLKGEKKIGKKNLKVK
jgi:hypothetical protein